MGSEQRDYDLVIFGASGFTGQYAVEEMARTARDDEAGIRWAVAGRSEQKLRSALKRAAEFTKIAQVESVPIIIADVANEESLLKMAKQTRVLLSCVGPYRFFGEPVVRACVQSGTHYLDVSGETQFLESTQLEYDKAAKEAQIYIIGSCGWDSVPAEMGLVFSERSAPGPLNSVEAFYKLQAGPHGAAVHYGTWQSAIHSFAHRAELLPIRKRLFPQRLQRPRHRLAARSVLSFSRETNEWCVPFPGSDRAVAHRTQRRLLQLGERQSCLQFVPYLQVGSLLQALLLLVCGSVFGIMAAFRPTRYLLETYPRVFSLGLFSHEGPTREQVETSSFSMTFVALGWQQQQQQQQADGEERPTVRTVCRVRGPEPGYIATPICLIQAALCVLRDAHSMPEPGVLTPGAAFRRTSLIERLSKSGFEFSVIGQDSVAADAADSN